MNGIAADAERVAGLWNAAAARGGIGLVVEPPTRESCRYAYM
jgi:hypothetical protein